MHVIQKKRIYKVDVEHDKVWSEGGSEECEGRKEIGEVRCTMAYGKKYEWTPRQKKFGNGLAKVVNATIKPTKKYK